MTDFPHPARPDPPHSGVFRTIYFLAVAAVAIFVALSAVFAFYDPPEGDTIDFPPGFEDSSSEFQDAENDRADYNRNVSLILSAVSAAVFAAAVLGFGSRFNPLRAGLLLGGLIIFLIAMGFWSDSGDQWIGFLMTLINFAVLAGCFLWLDEGLPLKPREEPRRLQPSDIAPPAPEPPPSRTEPPPPMSDLPKE